jgi:hypothetical protein
MKFTNHIELSDWNGQCLLAVRDIELHDFLDDFFVNQGIEALVVHPTDAPEQWQLLFPLAITNETLLRLLSQVGAAEVEHIVRINIG